MRISILSLQKTVGGSETEFSVEITDGENLQTIQGSVLTDLLSEDFYPKHIEEPVLISREACDELIHCMEETKAIKKGIALLAYSGCTIKAMKRKLMLKGFSEETSTEAAIYLGSHGFIREERDASMLLQTLVQRKLYGENRIKKELFAKGFDEDVIRKVLGELDTDFSDICARRIARMGGIECFSDRLSRQKIVASLMRYGFSYEDIREAIQKLSEKE